MDYRELRKLKMQLIQKEDKTEEELHLLAEIQSLGNTINVMEHSLSLPDKVCKTCGRLL